MEAEAYKEVGMSTVVLTCSPAVAPDLGMTGVPQPPRHVLDDALQGIDFPAQRDHTEFSMALVRTTF